MNFHKFLAILAVIIYASAASASLYCYTWNIEWFPSGKRDLRADNENERIQKAGEIFKNTFDTLQKQDSDPEQILFLQEIRDAITCSNLISSLNEKNLNIASISSFTDGTGTPIWQQTAIFTTLPVLEASYEAWHNEDGIAPPRGFTYALLSYKDEYIACFSLHLKSNLNWENTFLEDQLNIFKRESSAKQLLNKIKSIKAKHPDKTIRVLVAGDFNTNVDNLNFVSESTIRSFYGAHYRSCFRDTKIQNRITCPGKGKYPDATFDYILYKDFPERMITIIFPVTDIYDSLGVQISDHNIVGTKFE